MRDGSQGEGFHAEDHDRHAYRTGSYVELVSMKDGAVEALRVRCTLQDDGTVNMVGDAELVTELQQGFEAPFSGDRRHVVPQDGVLFLLGLEARFQSPYLFVRHPANADSP